MEEENLIGYSIGLIEGFCGNYIPHHMTILGTQGDKKTTISLERKNAIKRYVWVLCLRFEYDRD
jgi:hypothetical protein